MPASSKEFLDIQAIIGYGFTVKRVRDMTRTYSLAWVLIHMLCLSFCSFTCNIPCTVLYSWSTFIFLHIYSHIHTHRLIILVQLTTLSLGVGHLLLSSSRILQDLVKFYLRRCSCEASADRTCHRHLLVEKPELNIYQVVEMKNRRFHFLQNIQGRL